MRWRCSDRVSDVKVCGWRLCSAVESSVHCELERCMWTLGRACPERSMLVGWYCSGSKGRARPFIPIPGWGSRVAFTGIHWKYIRLNEHKSACLR